MDNFKNIELKLIGFIKKYYKNELIKGSILFFTFGFLYFLFTLLIESLFWLKPTYRLVLFLSFLIVEFLFFIKLICVPAFKLIGIQKRISFEQASIIIGNHFSEVDDKLLNLLQLKENSDQTELLLASIEQKVSELKPIDFKTAVSFKDNLSYLKFFSIPILIVFVLLITDFKNNFFFSLDRVVHPQTFFEKPAPFTFNILNDSLDVVEGKSFTLKVTTIGRLAPEKVSIFFSGEAYDLSKNEEGFYFTFNSLSSTIDFYLKANDVRSPDFKLNVIAIPSILDLEMHLIFPFYTNRPNEIISGSGSTSIPEGTRVSWYISAKNTDAVHFKTADIILPFSNQDNQFTYSNIFFNSFKYQIFSSNASIPEHDKLNFSIDVIKDNYPKIIVKNHTDSIHNNSQIYYGRISDDYGIHSLKFFYRNNKSSSYKNIVLPVSKSSIQSFMFEIPDSLLIDLGVTYDFFFEVRDNDKFHNYKKTSSGSFSLYVKTESELQDDVLNKQKESLSDLNNAIKETNVTKPKLDLQQKALINKKQINQSDIKNLKDIIENQSKHNKELQQYVSELKKQVSNDPISKDDSEKQELLDRIEETEELLKNQKKLQELDDLITKLDKDKISDKLNELKNENSKNEKNLDRILELTKRFYIEQKLSKLDTDLKQLSQAQDSLSNIPSNSEDQKKLNDEFHKLSNDYKELKDENSSLKKSMSLPKVDDVVADVKKEQKEALDKLSQENNSSSKVSSNQKSAAKSMQQISQSLSSSLSSMSGQDSIEEDIASLRIILENLISFSFSQEDLLNDFHTLDSDAPQVSTKLKEQYALKEYFHHIDDSLYTLSLRQPKLSNMIIEHVYDVHYYLDESLDHISDNKIQQSLSDQQHIIYSTNELALLLSSLLSNLQNSNSNAAMGQGSKGKGKPFGLPDIIQGQENLMQDSQTPSSSSSSNSSEKGKGNKSSTSNSTNSNADATSKELYEIYKRQSLLKSQLNDIYSNSSDKAIKNDIINTLNKMSTLESRLLEDGVTSSNKQLMNSIYQDLLKLDRAINQKSQEIRRESSNSNSFFETQPVDSLSIDKLWHNEDEILNRESLPLYNYYNQKVIEYFN